MANQQELMAEFERRAHDEQDKFKGEHGCMTTWGEATVLVGLWANTPHCAVWQLADDREVRITFGDPGRGPDDAAVVLTVGGKLIKRWGLPPGLRADAFCGAVERFLKEARS